MTSLIVRWCAIVLCGGAVLAQAPQAPPQSGLSLGGRVVDTSTRRPVSGASVTIRGPVPLPDPPTLIADAEGRFRFDALRPGRYTLTATAVGYLAGGDHLEAGIAPPDTSVQLEDGVSQTDLQLGLVPPASISGIVVDSDNAPVESAQMGALREVYVAGHRRFEVGGSATSDDAGQFRFGFLAPGRYIVCVIGERITVPVAAQAALDRAASGSPQERMEFQLRARQSGMAFGAERGFAAGDFWIKPGNVSVGPIVTADGTVWSAPDTCNGGARSPLKAPVIALAAGEPRLNEVLVVDLAPAVSVSGQLVGPNGPMPWHGVSIESDGFEALGWMEGMPYAFTTSDGDGRFTFLGVVPGDYQVKAYQVPGATPGAPPGTLPDGEALSGSASLSVGRENVDGVQLRLTAASRVRGRLEFVGSVAAPSTAEILRATVTFTDADGVSTRRAWLRPTVVVQPDGVFDVVGLLPGRYVVAVAPLGPWRIHQALVGGVDVSDVPLELSDAALPEVVIRMTDAPARLTGTVRDEKGLVVPAAHVVAYPVDRTRWVGQGAQPRRQQRVDVRNGVFSIEGLPAGDYFLVPLSQAEATDWQQPARLEAWSSSAMRVTLLDRESRTIDLTLRLRSGGEQ